MGRGCGYLAVMAGIVCGAEMVLIPEVPVKVEEVAKAVGDAYRRGKTHAIIVVAEGASVKTTELAAALDAKDVGFTTRVTILGHIQRGGSPTAFDRMLASRLGIKAVQALLSGESDVMVGLQGREVGLIPLAEVTTKSRTVSAEYIEMARMLAR
jgi:6-phosphofructokinase 1